MPKVPQFVVDKTRMHFSTLCTAASSHPLGVTHPWGGLPRPLYLKCSHCWSPSQLLACLSLPSSLVRLEGTYCINIGRLIALKYKMVMGTWVPRTCWEDLTNVWVHFVVSLLPRVYSISSLLFQETVPPHQLLTPGPCLRVGPHGLRCFWGLAYR